LYTPLLYSWARRVGLQDADAADLVQDVLTSLVKKLPELIYDQQKSFRSWLRTVTFNRWRDNCKQRGKQALQTNETALAVEPSRDDPDDFWQAEYRRHLVGRALDVMQNEFHPATWKACWEFVIGGKSAAVVAAELGISENAVFLAKSRVLRRLRQELAGLFD
jgi:RNA polymerase sigma-70 factor (ECF subfamily)